MNRADGIAGKRLGPGGHEAPAGVAKGSGRFCIQNSYPRQYDGQRWHIFRGANLTFIKQLASPSLQRAQALTQSTLNNLNVIYFAIQ